MCEDSTFELSRSFPVVQNNPVACTTKLGIATVIAGQVKPIRTTVEGLLRSIAADAAGGLDCALYDKTFSHASGAGLLFNQVVRCMSHAVVSGSSDAVLSVLCRL